MAKYGTVRNYANTNIEKVRQYLLMKNDFVSKEEIVMATGLNKRQVDKVFEYAKPKGFIITQAEGEVRYGHFGKELAVRQIGIKYKINFQGLWNGLYSVRI